MFMLRQIKCAVQEIYQKHSEISRCALKEQCYTHLCTSQQNDSLDVAVCTCL